jgi:hypothetical protein
MENPNIEISKFNLPMISQSYPHRRTTCFADDTEKILVQLKYKYNVNISGFIRVAVEDYIKKNNLDGLV